jgi:hypothetical protein
LVSELFWKSSLPRWPRRKLTSLPGFSASCCCSAVDAVPLVMNGYWLSSCACSGEKYACSAPVRSVTSVPVGVPLAQMSVFQVKLPSAALPRMTKMARLSHAANVRAPSFAFADQTCVDGTPVARSIVLACRSPSHVPD